MNFTKIAGLIAAVAAIAAAGAICMVATAFAIYAALREAIGPAWAAAAVVGIIALIAVVIALIAFRKARSKPVKGEPAGFTAKLIDLASERPVLAAGLVTAAAAAAVAVAVKNPRVLTAIIVGLFSPPPSPPRR